MGQDGHIAEFIISGPDGTPLTLADLPPATTRRWRLDHKAKVVIAVESGLLSFREACDRYQMSLEEFQSWEVEMRLRGLSQKSEARFARPWGLGHEIARRQQ